MDCANELRLRGAVVRQRNRPRSGFLVEFLTTAWLLGATILQAGQGVLIVENVNDKGGKHARRLQLESNQMRIDSVFVVSQPMHDQDGLRPISSVTLAFSNHHGAILFNGATNLVQLIDLDDHTYKEVSSIELSKVQTYRQAKADKEKEFRAQHGIQNVLGMPPRTYRRRGNETIGKWSCAKYDALSNNVVIGAAWTVDPGTVGLISPQVELANRLADILKTIHSNEDEEPFRIGVNATPGYQGFPIRRRWRMGMEQHDGDVVVISQQTFSDSSYVIPNGFTKQEFKFP